MPNKKSYRNNGNGHQRRNGGGYARQSYRSCATMAYTDAARALSLAKYVKGLVNVEFKEVNTQRTATALSTSIAISHVSGIAQGDTKIARGGNKVRFKSLHWRGFITMNASATTTMVRLMIILDKQVNGAVFTIGDLLEDATAGDAIISPRDIDNQNRFTVLSDKTYKLTDNGGNQLVQFNVYKKINLPVRYDGTTANVGDLTSNGLFLVSFSNEATNTPAITDFFRIRFIDN